MALVRKNILEYILYVKRGRRNRYSRYFQYLLPIVVYGRTSVRAHGESCLFLLYRERMIEMQIEMIMVVQDFCLFRNFQIFHEKGK